MDHKKVSNCHGADLLIRLMQDGQTFDGYDCDVCRKPCIAVDEEDQFWDASVARARGEHDCHLEANFGEGHCDHPSHKEIGA